MNGSAAVVKTVQTIEHAIARILAPELQSNDARFIADMTCRLLQWLEIQVRDGASLHDTHRDTLESIMGEAATFLRLAPGSDNPEGGVPGQLMRHFGETGDDQSLALIDRLIAAETAFIQGQDPEAGCSIAENYRGGRRTVAQVAQENPHAVTEDSLTAYLRRRFAGSNLAATDVLRLTGGLGKDTILFNIVGDGPVTGPAVMRKDLAVPPMDASAIDEAPLLQALAAHDIPVPELLWSESERHWFGGAFIVMRKAPGSIDTSSWIDQPELSRSFARTLARTMARCHALSAADIGYHDAPRTAEEGTRAYLYKMRDLFRRKSPEFNPRLETLFAWLLENIPGGDRPSRLVHGDIGFHNLLIEDGDVTAILDWENFHFGDPAEDVAYVRQFVEQALPWQDFLDIYYEEGGPEYTAAHDRFFSVWGNARNGVGCAGAEYAYRAMPPGNVKYATVGLIYGPRWEIEALHQMRELLTRESVARDEASPIAEKDGVK